MTPQPDLLEASLNRGLAYLAAVQRPDGSFDTFSSSSTIRFEKTFTYQTTFTPSLILAALGDLHTPLSRRLSRHLATFIKAQRSSLWSFNYWAQSSPERHRQPYPDDLDDTCCALIALQRHNPASISPEILAATVKLLLATETQPGGPYRTWLVPPDATDIWRDVDLAVNANVAYFLSMVSEPLPNLTELMEQAIRDEYFVSPYYASVYPIIYYLSRAYQGELKPKLLTTARRLGAKPETLTALQNGLLLTSLLRLGAPADSHTVTHLLKTQREDGSWPAEAFCLDPARDGITYYNGSEALTTALVLESLQLYRQTTDMPPTGGVGQPHTTLSTKAPARRAGETPHEQAVPQVNTAFRTDVLAGVPRDMKETEPDLYAATVDFTNRLARSNSGVEIVTLPLYFNQSLHQPLPEASRPMLLQLGMANLYGWAAYTIYDDFLDDEGQPALLPVASTALRYSLFAFDRALPDDEAFQEVVRQTFDTIDSANAWEVNHCRFLSTNQQLVIKALPDYGDPAHLADRSLGHCLTPLAVLRAKGSGTDSKAFRTTRQAIIHYLAARQLNDDAHDWQVDLQNGHITYVVSRLLADEQVKPGRYNADNLLKRLQQRFWHQTLLDICQLMREQTALSRRSLRNLPELQSPNVLSELIDEIDASVAETLAAQDRAQSFLKHYKRDKVASL